MVGQSQQGTQLTVGVFLLVLIIYLIHVNKSEQEVRVDFEAEKSAYKEKEVHPLEYSGEDVFYMAQAIYFEAILEPEKCQLQVAHVIDTRRYSSKFPNTIREVVWQPKQFSYTADGRHERMTDIEARTLAERIAKLVLGGYSLDTTEGSLYYYNPDLADPSWKDSYQVVNKCGKHLFLKEKETKTWG